MKRSKLLSIFFIVLVLLACFVPLIQFAYTTTIFSSGFESGGFVSDGWVGTVTNGGATATVTSGNAHHGTYKAEFASLQDAADEAHCYVSVTPTTELYACAQIEWVSNVFSGAGIQDIGPFFSNAAMEGLAFVGYNPSTSKWVAEYFVGSSWTSVAETGTSSVSAGVYYHTELHYKINNGAGVVELWVDGVQKIQSTGLDTTSDRGNIGNAHVGVYINYAEASARTVYADCFYAADTYIGPEAPEAFYPYVQQQSNVDSSADIGTHSNFTAQQYGPDLINDTMTEASSGGSTSNVFTEGFEDGTFTKWTDGGTTTWGDGGTFMATNSSPGSPWVTHSGTYMADCDSNDDGNLISDNIDMSGKTAIGVSFWHMDDDMDGNDFYFQVYNGSTYNQINALSASGTGNEDVWIYYSWTTTDSQYLISTFRIDFYAVPGTGEGAFIDDVIVNATTSNYRLDLEEQFTNIPCSTEEGVFTYYPFNEGIGSTTQDMIYGNNGTIIGASWVDGRYGKALSFDGTSNYVDCGDIAALNSASQFTLIGWIKQNDNSRWERAFNKITDSSYDISVAPFAGSLFFEVGNGENSYAYWSDYGTEIPSGTWFHVAAVFDGGGATNPDKAKLYVNGVAKTLVFSGNFPSSTADLTDVNLTIGDQGYGDEDWFQGIIDEVQIYNHALSAEEILELYNSDIYTNKEICIYMGPYSNSETIYLQGWNIGNSSWTNITSSLTANQWNNITVLPWLNTNTYANLTIRFLDGTQTSDTVQNNWQKDCTLLYLGNVTTQNYIRSASQTISPIISAARSVSSARSASSIMQILLSAARLGAFTRPASNIIQILLSSARSSTFTRSASNIMQILLSTLRLFSGSRSSTQFLFNPGLVGWWHFDEGTGTTAYDSSGNGNNGAIYDATWVDGKYGSALNFTGKTFPAYSHVDFGHPSSLNVPKIYISAWIKMAESRTNIIVNKEYPYLDYNFFVDSSDKLNFWLSSDGISFDVQVTGGTTLFLDEWYYVSVNYDQTSVQLFVNAIPDNSPIETTASINKNGGVSIGWDGGVSFNGTIDEVHIYNHALSAAEVQTDFQEGPNLINKYITSTRVFTGYRSSSQSIYSLLSVSRIFGAVRSNDQTVNIISSAVRSLSLGRSFSQIVNALASPLRVFRGGRSSTQVVQMFSSAVRSLSLGRPWDQTINILTSALRIFGATRAYDQTVNILTSALRIFGATRAYDQTVNIVSSATRSLSLGRSISDIVNFLFSAVRSTGFNRVSSSIVQIILSVQRQMSINRSGSVFVEIFSSAVRSLGLERSVAQTAQIILSSIRTVGLRRGLSQIVTLLSSGMRTLSFSRATTQIIRILTSATRTANYFRISDLLIYINAVPSPLKFIIYIYMPTPAPPSGVMPVPAVTLDVTVESVKFYATLWNPAPTFNVFVVNKGVESQDVVFNYTVTNSIDNTVAASGSQTVYITTNTGKTLMVQLPHLPDGHYFITVSAIAPVYASAQGDLIISSPFYGQLWFIALVVVIAVVLMVLINRRRRR
jgi:hypothetical protein